MTHQMEQAPNKPDIPEINIRVDRGLPLKWRLARGVGVVALAGVAVAGAGQYFDIPGIPKFGDYTSSTLTPEKTTIVAKTIDIIPINFECTTMAAYNAGDETDSQGTIVTPGSETAVKTHGFVHAAHANNAKVVTTICATDVKVEAKDTGINVAENTVTKDIFINVDSFVTNAQFSEPDTQIVDVSGGWTELLTGSGGAADAIADGFCQIVTAWNCDKGVANPADAAVKVSREDQAKTEQYLRISILEAIQNKCLAGDWASFKQAIIESYKKQASLQGASEDSVRVHFVDSNNNEISSIPDFTKKAIQPLIDAGAINGSVKDKDGNYIVEVIDTKPTINCVSLVPAVTSADLAGLSSVGAGSR